MPNPDAVKRPAPSLSSAPDAFRIEYMPLRALRRAAHNPKRHDAAALTKSLDRFGYVAPMVLDEATERLVAGHGRLEALAAARDAGATPPARVQVTADDWLVPVIRGVRFASDADAAAYLLADNKLVELGGWDDAELAAMLRDLDGDVVASTGFSSREVDVLLRSIAEPVADPGAQVDRAAELQAKWGTARGQLWTVGRHRVLCGDATSAEDVARLMGEERAALFSTDPPYGVDFEGAKYNPRAKAWDGIQGDTRQGQDLRAWLAACLETWAPFVDEDSSYYVWAAAMEEGAAAAAIRDAGLHIQGQIIWNKNTLVLGQADYQWKHENCWYAFRKGMKHRWFGGRTQTTVWDVPKDANSAYQHPMQKPVELYAIPIRNHTLEGSVCAEPFAGSGSQFVAAEQLGRRCYGLEIEPGYTAVILERLSGLGLTPELVP